ncbi:very short patch repair endonuclease [uncultured Acetobacterium sp.]|uniref:very short patch repair endonuclease n=1 Tax=uncultured Acetobacterium sp. TaxID=217139 RepID=UPI0025D6D9F7|nr:very short patch repair endonuclease [uncultured Acetobacterium sp.]
MSESLDKITKTQRSANMSKIRSNNTTPELFIRKALYIRNLRYRINYKDVSGTPDLYFTKNSTAVFVNGCYWHRHENCKDATTPKTNTEFWNKKFSENTCRDARIKAELMSSGIRILIIWECTIKKMMKNQNYREEMLDLIIQFIKDSEFNYLEI